MNYRYIMRDDPEFPDRIRQKPQKLGMPGSLWTRGDTSLDLLKGPTLAIVGARACSVYGRNIAQEYARVASEHDIVVISGLARGVDVAAHKGAVNVVGGGKTVAVLGCGIDNTYPASHDTVAHAMVAEGGLIISEWEPGVSCAPWRFASRNRIIAALADVVLVVEARFQSGSLITCDFALEMGIPVLAIPGQNDSELSAGPNSLIQTGRARICTRFQDVLDELEAVRA